MPFAFDSLRRPDAPRLFARMGTYAFAVLAFLTLALAGLAPPVIELALPADYRSALPLIPLLAVAMAAQSLAWFPMTSVNVAKQTHIYPVVTAIGAAVSIAANLLLIPRFGMRGAAVALLSSQVVATVVTAYFAQRAYWIPYEVARLSKVLGISAFTYLAMAAVASASLWWTLALRAGLLGLFPLGLLVLRFFEPHELAEIRKVVAAIGRRAAQPDEPQTLSTVPMDR
jgi:O-antigen/teichoic acid export membrane protein